MKTFLKGLVPSMPCMAETVESGEIGAPPRLMVIGGEAQTLAEVAGPLEAEGYQVRRVGPEVDLTDALQRESPALIIRAVGKPAASAPPPAELRSEARKLGIPVLEVVERIPEPSGSVEDADVADDWVVRRHMAEELPARVARLLRRRDTAGDPSPRADGPPSPAAFLPIDHRFCSLVVHDMRTPLNVISLSLRMIEQAMPKGDPELDEDLRFVDENFKQIERMLSQLSDYCRLFGPEVQLSPAQFSPERLVNELTENRRVRAGAKVPPIRVEVRPDCPAEVTLDQTRARVALQYALENASAAAGGGSLAVVLRGGPGRWVTEFRVDLPPPSSVQSTALQGQQFERLCGIAAERRGMDLAIAARVTELFGGGSRLDAVPNESTTVVLDWPARLTEA